jgi:hypothetical protein
MRPRTQHNVSTLARRAVPFTIRNVLPLQRITECIIVSNKDFTAALHFLFLSLRFAASHKPWGTDNRVATKLKYVAVQRQKTAFLSRYQSEALN